MLRQTDPQLLQVGPPERKPIGTVVFDTVSLKHVLGNRAVRPSRAPAVRENPAPVAIGAGVGGVPVPVLHHARTAGNQSPGRLTPLTVVGGTTVRGENVPGVGFGDKERLLA